MSSNVNAPGKAVPAARPWWLDLLLTRAPGSWRSSLARMGIMLLVFGGGVLALYSGYIHLYLWGRQSYPYSAIPTIGPLFLVQGIAALLIGLLVGITRRLYAVLLGAGLMAVSVAALVIDVEVGMFGFQDSWAAPYVTSTLYWEIVGAVVLVIAAAALAWPAPPGPAVAARSWRGR
jgi:hypothetical protein